MCDFCGTTENVERRYLGNDVYVSFCSVCVNKAREVENKKLMDDLRALRPKLDAGLRYLKGR